MESGGTSATPTKPRISLRYIRATSLRHFHFFVLACAVPAARLRGITSLYEASQIYTQFNIRRACQNLCTKHLGTPITRPASSEQAIPTAAQAADFISSIRLQHDRRVIFPSRADSSAVNPSFSSSNKSRFFLAQGLTLTGKPSLPMRSAKACRCSADKADRRGASA